MITFSIRLYAQKYDERYSDMAAIEMLTVITTGI